MGRHGLSFPVYSSPTAQTMSAYRFSTTPETLVISQSGSVLADWRGAYVGDTKLLIERYFHIELPDLRDSDF